ncbi:glutamate--tRNA ligase [Malaciobacter mytili]|uniref:Glutamate--tRNA ligase n=1 Tax=Malaciobacter mytili LMG 24559 TaxID=1032238 RepID=A0AAX2AIZ2_9BACT|nr:glutamate--tRNA ligase [Malaciobacter mytili]AXH13675.1 glutamyl-tRNA synthetase [Malaciobacter mytili LMG 24559]RXI45313.1 glutamate--tRNA ligase [Malaciobacter mytili]RXK16287.1 glutamate--tRNA ligase [Malaciobacter mytili LMG 24559]
MAVTRFAPSPTGYLHIGGLRTALYNYLWARKTNGVFRLRIEDTDTQRNNEDAMKAIINAFDWVGLNYDGVVEYQSQRMDIYKKYIQQLLDDGKAYYCYMSKEELDALREEQMANKQTPRYDGRYRDFTGTPPQGVEPVVRIKAPQEGKITFVDGVKSIMNINCDEVDDFVIARSNGFPTYNFVVAIDDALMGITDVIRGDDHLTNTAKQIIVYEALGFEIPKFYHVPMINNPQGKKLSKRDGAMDVMEYKNQGYLPEALLNFLVRLGWSNKDQEIFSMEEMLELFDPQNINKSASSYNQEKLLWLNAHYIKNISNERLSKELEFFDCYLEGHDKKEMILDLTKERAQTLVELKDAIANILNRPESYEEKGVNKFIKEDTAKFLDAYLKTLEETKESLHLACDYETVTKPFIEKFELKFPQLFQPIRIALTGGTQAPSVYDIMAILGYEEVNLRIRTALDKNFK